MSIGTHLRVPSRLSYPEHDWNDSMTTATETKPQDSRGLAGQTIGDTDICSVNQTQLIYRGYEIADLAANATFE